ncbi:hypothetical protein FRAHR75_380006 [Frankia sp. Hr75.2]|nr:hypothetical protein FRAHR75_380006 [Frankia sp. Hr75.2]SQD97874.1 hypothetical protein FMEAI12_4330031 [Parafrankia sp. Ea1.12]
MRRDGRCGVTGGTVSRRDCPGPRRAAPVVRPASVAGVTRRYPALALPETGVTYDWRYRQRWRRSTCPVVRSRA